MPDHSAQKDVADALEALAKKMRKVERADQTPHGIEVTLPPELPGEGEPMFSEVDIFSDETHVTVTAQTLHADAAEVHVSVADGRLFLGIGDGEPAIRKDVVLPGPVDEDQAYATFRNGVLDVVLPRRT